MSHYIIGKFRAGRSGSPYSFICLDPHPTGPYLSLNSKLTLDRERPNEIDFYLVEVEDWGTVDQRVQYARRLLTTMFQVRWQLVDALKASEWEMDPKTYQRKLVGGPLKSEYGYFEAIYDNGNHSNSFVSPSIKFRIVRDSSNPYYEAFVAAHDQLFCPDEEEIKRVHEMSRATANLGGLLREKHGL